MYFISRQCSQYLTNVNYHQFLKYQILSGLGVNRIGLYSQCLEDPNNQFYLIVGLIQSIKNLQKKMFMTGICFKNVCSANDLQYVARSMNQYVTFPFTLVRIETPSEIQQVYDYQTIIVISILSILVLLFVICSILDLMKIDKKINKEMKFIEIFSIKTTLKLLKSRSEQSTQRIRTFSGIKTLSLIGIIFTNVLIIAFYAPTTSFQRKQNQLIYIMFYGVDIWMMTSGFFVSYLLLKQFQKLKSFKILILKIFRRFSRFWPIYSICLCLNWNIIQLLGYGPLSPLLRDFPKKHCTTYLSHFLMVSNFFQEKCYNPLWILELDLQLCFIFIPILIIYIKSSNSKLYKYLYLILQLIFFISSFLFTLVNMPKGQDLNNYFFGYQYKKFNILPFVRCGGFLIGYNLGIFYYEFKKSQIKHDFWLIKILNQTKYRVSLIILGIVGLSFIISSFFIIKDNSIQQIHIIYFACLRSLIPFSIMLIILPSLFGYLSPIKKLFQSWVCNFISKLSLTTLCLHYIIAIYIIFNRQFDLELSNFTIFNISCCTILPSIFLSIILTSIIEIPVFVCKKIYWKTQRITYFEH